MDIAGYLKQTASHEPLITPDPNDEWANARYGPPVAIAVRRTRNEKASRKGQSYKVDYQTKYLSRVRIKNGDKLDGQEILQVEDLVDLQGVTLGTTSYTSESRTFG